MFLSTVIVIIGAAAIALAWSKMGRKSTKGDYGRAILITILGFIVLFLATGVTDPPNGNLIINLDTETVVTWITLLLGFVSFTKAAIWAIGKTDFWKKLISTLDHIEKTCDHLENLKEMYKFVHEDELSVKKKRKT